MPPVDPLLPARLRALAAVTRAETRVRRGWWGAIRRFLDRIRGTVLRPYREAGRPPDPAGVYVGPDVWPALVDEHVMPAVTEAARTQYEAITDEPFDQDAFISNYLAQSRNRLLGVPDEVYAMLVAQIDAGLQQGTSIPDLAADIEKTLTANGVPTWRNRATTVARTEAIGANNAGADAAARVEAVQLDLPDMQKVWVATMAGPAALDTRPTHREADGQRVALNEPFVVGGYQLAFPGDPTGPPQEVINCRCTAIYVTPDETIDWTNRQYPEEGTP